MTVVVLMVDPVLIKDQIYPIADLCRPLGLQEVEASRISRQLAHEGGKVVGLTQRPPLSPRIILGTYFCQRLSRPHCHIATRRIKSEVPMIPSGIEPATFWLVAQCPCVYVRLKHRVNPRNTFLVFPTSCSTVLIQMDGLRNTTV